MEVVSGGGVQGPETRKLWRQGGDRPSQTGHGLGRRGWGSAAPSSLRGLGRVPCPARASAGAHQTSPCPFRLTRSVPGLQPKQDDAQVRDCWPELGEVAGRQAKGHRPVHTPDQKGMCAHPHTLTRMHRYTCMHTCAHTHA